MTDERAPQIGGPDPDDNAPALGGAAAVAHIALTMNGADELVRKTAVQRLEAIGGEQAVDV
ncbi:MAG: hypothetical protein ACFB51_13900 [Anaerolineae bacterium]